MCPPPSDPIRPIGPVAGDVYVARSEFAERVSRRSRRQRDDEHPTGGHGAEDEQPEDDDDPPVPEAWFKTVAPLKAAGGYDDHGRTATPDATDASRAHVDKTA